jgi:hypothetical protein
MPLNKFPSYEELRKDSIMNNDEDNEGYSILDIIEKPIRDNDIFLIS